MNNSGLIPQEEPKPDISERKGKLTTLIESLGAILVSEEGRTLKKEFDVELERLNRVLKTESRKRPVNTDEIHYLQGRIESMERFDLEKMLQKYRTELETITRI